MAPDGRKDGRTTPKHIPPPMAGDNYMIFGPTTDRQTVQLLYAILPLKNDQESLYTMEWSAATAMHELLITNTILPLHTRYRTSWMHPCSNHQYLIDYVILRNVTDGMIIGK
ncbi:hypothetical protein DPMN_059191 [Dreissena polymorpha]|uniref:Uncharacterized protein n=1 Tax=Dreissena polymorpha TaxID=45954 RepID=A0A9D4C342_DREPO|nr:hypothetical protein DPMN_059191 [Dreissena polymorpha]